MIIERGIDSFMQLGTGASTRSFQDKLREQYLSVLDYGADPTGTVDSYAAIQNAIDALVALTHKRLYFPPGVYLVSDTLLFEDQRGIEVFGAGQGQGSSIANSGTSIEWTGAANGTVMSLLGTQWSWFHDFHIDGDDVAGVVFALNGKVTAGAQCNTIERITTSNTIGTTPGYGIHVGDSTNMDTSQNVFNQCTTINNKYGLVQEGTQTVSNVYNACNWVYTGATLLSDVEVLADFRGGDVTMIRCRCLGGCTTAQVRIGTGSYWARLEGNYQENGTGITTAGPAWLFPAGSRVYPTLCIGNRIQWNPTDAGNHIIRYLQNDIIHILGNTFETTSGTGQGLFTFDNDVGGAPARLNWQDNKINNSSNLLFNLQTNFYGVIDPTAIETFGGSSTPAPLAIFGLGSAQSQLLLSSPDPQLIFRQSDGAANNRVWDIVPFAEALHMRLLNDARAAGTDFLTVQRTGNTVDSVTIGGPLAVPSVAIAGGSAIAGLDSGTYTPTLTNVANLDASTAWPCQWMRVGTVVTVSGQVDVDPTTTGVSTALGISLPIASNLGSPYDCAGTAAMHGTSNECAGIYADATNNRAEMGWKAVDDSNQPRFFTFTYRII